jgi:poly-gamma-glutamate capsule biosynthesis protein CapA/YwtB (metallophosphatase superfamily)
MKRDHRVMAIFLVVTAAGAGFVGIRTATAGPPPVAAIVRDVPLGADGRLSLQFVGDTMLGDEAQAVIDQHGYDWPLEGVRSMLDADVVVANAEAPITDRTVVFNPLKKFSYATRPQVMPALARAGVDALGTNNNHTFDVGPEGLADTMRHAAESGIETFGAGPDLARAEQPLLLRSELGTVAIVGLGENFGSSTKARDTSPGTVVLSPESVQRGADLARAAGADWVIGSVQWGDNYLPVNAEQRFWAQEFAKAGYDMVIGAGAHFVQPVEMVGAMPVFFSVGNFVFGSPGGFANHGVEGFGLIVKIDFGPDTTAAVSSRCVQTDNEIVAFQPRPCSIEQARKVLSGLHPSMTMTDDEGVLPCGCFIRPERRYS